MKKTALLLSTILLASLSSCEQEVSSTPSTEPNALESVFKSSPPAEAVSVGSLRETAKPGESVTFTGQILGAHDVFMEDRAVMIVGDPTRITACNAIPGDGCETPWDVCCDDPDVIKQSIVTVQVLDANGQPIKNGLKGQNGLTELSTVTVSGTVSDTSNDENMVVEAKTIVVEPNPS